MGELMCWFVSQKGYDGLCKLLIDVCQFPSREVRSGAVGTDFSRRSHPNLSMVALNVRIYCASTAGVHDKSPVS